MSLIVLVLFLIAVSGGGAIVYGGYRLFRSAEIDDELTERKRLAEEAKQIEELEKLYPGQGAALHKKKVKRFLKRT